MFDSGFRLMPRPVPDRRAALHTAVLRQAHTGTAGRPLTGRESPRTPRPRGAGTASAGSPPVTQEEPRRIRATAPTGLVTVSGASLHLLPRLPGRVPQRRQYSHGWSRLPAPDRGSGEPRAPPPGLAVFGPVPASQGGGAAGGRTAARAQSPAPSGAGRSAAPAGAASGRTTCRALA
jgi:hypothetical protein